MGTFELLEPCDGNYHARFRGEGSRKAPALPGGFENIEADNKMGRMKELAMNEERIKFEKAEAAFLALPEAQVEALDGIKDLMESHKYLLQQNQDQNLEIIRLKDEFVKQNSEKAKWKERGIGFASGILASLMTTAIF